jgi:release factor glutamine methyltransferase
MNWGESELWLRKELTGTYDDREAANIASWVLEHLTGASRIDRLNRKDDPLRVEQLHHLTEIHHRLLQHEPVQYVLGESYFYGLKLYVDNNVLIPRPETEELVDWIVKDVKASGKDVFERRAFEADVTTQLKILDVGTGSGCIALALKKAMPKAEVWGCDVSEGALNVARRNGSELNIRVDFQGLDFLDPAQQKSLPTADIIVSNPPYIPLNNREAMRPNVVAHEPHTALFVPSNNALVFYEALARFGHHRLYSGGSIYCEIHEDLSHDVIALFDRSGYTTELKKDMQGKDRMVKATAPTTHTAVHTPNPQREDQRT